MREVINSLELYRNKLLTLYRNKFGEQIDFEFLMDNQIIVTVPKELLVSACLYTQQTLKAPLVDMIGTDEREIDECYGLYYVFASNDLDLFITISTRVERDNPAFPSVTPAIHAAHWYEREVKDMLGVHPIGHPDPKRLVRHFWSKEVHPLRKDIPKGMKLPRTDKELPFKQVKGEGIFQVPVGPIHAGIIEPGHFRFSVQGEYIINLEAKLFYTHRGIEKLAEEMNFHQALPLVERICGVCSFSHSTSYCQAVEKLAGTEIPDRARYIRTIILELERLYNHLGDVGNICAGTGFTFGISQGSRLKETMMQLNERIAGNRYLRGINVPGGVQLDLDNEISMQIRETLTAVAGDFRELKEILVNNDSFNERLIGTGVLPPEIALKMNVVGPGGRASGSRRDVRKNHPYAAYSNTEFQVPSYTAGDVKSRLLVRIDEIEESFGIISQALAAIPGGKLNSALGPIKPQSYALGYTESPRGENIHWVMAGQGNTIFRYRVRSASYTNWPAVQAAVPGNMVPDFPFINKSFELFYSCLGR